MKKLTGLVVILAALVLGSFYGMGYLTERKVKEDLNIVNQTNGLSAEIEKYKRGWFTSDATIKWKLHVPEHAVTSADGQSKTVSSEDYQMEMPLTIHHGPIILADKGVKLGLGYAHTDIALPPKFVEQFNDTFSNESTQPKLGLSLFVGYLNNSTIDVSVPAFKLIARQGNGQLDWLGMTSATNVSSHMDKVDGNITIDGLRIAKDQIKTVMSAVTSEYNLRKSDSGLYIGDASLSFPSLIVTNNDKKIFELRQADLHSDTNIEDGLFGSHFKSSVEKVFINDKTYGPGSFEMALRNLDADVLARINEQMNQAQQGSDVERQKVLLAVLPELPKLFSKGPEFEITEMNFVMPEGTVEGNLLISLPKTDAGNPFELIQKIQGKGKLKVPAVVLKNIVRESIKQKLMAPQATPQSIQQGIVQQMQQQAGQAANPSANNTNGSNQPATPAAAMPPAPAPNPAEIAQQAEGLADKQLASMVQSGILAMQGNEYVVEVNLNQGQLTVNGKPFSPAMLKFQ